MFTLKVCSNVMCMWGIEILFAVYFVCCIFCLLYILFVTEPEPGAWVRRWGRTEFKRLLLAARLLFRLTLSEAGWSSDPSIPSMRCCCYIAYFVSVCWLCLYLKNRHNENSFTEVNVTKESEFWKYDGHCSKCIINVLYIKFAFH